MNRLSRFLVVMTLLVAVSFPVLVDAFIPIGGKVTGIVTCLQGGGYLYTVVGFGIGSGVFLFAPGAITYPFGPPIVGRWVLGLSDIVSGCGARTSIIGSSLAL